MPDATDFEFDKSRYYHKLVQVHVAERKEARRVRAILLSSDSYLIGSSEAEANVILGGEANRIIDSINKAAKVSHRVARYHDISPAHAELRRDGSRWFITDLGSASGTFVNGRKLAPNRTTEIKQGRDALRIGTATFQLEPPSKPELFSRGNLGLGLGGEALVLDAFYCRSCPSCNAYPVSLPPCQNCGRKSYRFHPNVWSQAPGDITPEGLACCHCPMRYDTLRCACGCALSCSGYVFTDVVFNRSGCFIATELYGAQSIEVALLRAWRDEQMMTSQIGRRLVSFYYCVSPTIVQVIRRSPMLCNALRSVMGIAISVLNRKQKYCDSPVYRPVGTTMQKEGESDAST